MTSNPNPAWLGDLNPEDHPGPTQAAALIEIATELARLNAHLEAQKPLSLTERVKIYNDLQKAQTDLKNIRESFREVKTYVGRYDLIEAIEKADGDQIDQLFILMGSSLRHNSWQPTIMISKMVLTQEVLRGLFDNLDWRGVING